jgi:8-oxo-dGTP pyrophosphatase MutT (NUDIX family)
VVTPAEARASPTEANRSPASDREPPVLASAEQLLRAWRPPDDDQEQLRLHYLDHLAAHRDGWSRTCPGAHLTASSLICAPAEGQVLLTLHARLGRWLQTGGHVEADDLSMAAAAGREAAEESGLTRLDVDPEPLLLSRHELSCSGRPTFHLDVQFLVTTSRSDPPRFGAESLDVRWFRPDQLPGVDQSVLDLVAAADRRLSGA